MAIQRFAADSGYIVVGDRQHGGEEPGWQATSCVIHIILKLSLGCGRAGANRPSKPSPQLSIGAMRHQSSFRVQSLPSCCSCNSRHRLPRIRFCGKVPANMVNDSRGTNFRARRRGGTSTEIFMFPVTWTSRDGVIVRHVARRFRRSWERSRARRLGCICSRSHFSRIVCHICGSNGRWGIFGGYDAEACNQRSC